MGRIYESLTPELQGDRDLIQRWAEKKGPDRTAEYRRQKNAASLDGLPGLRVR